MTDAEAIEMAKRYGLPIISIPPLGVIDEVITVDLRDNPPTVWRRPSPVVGGAPK